MPLPLKIFINYRREDRPEIVKKIRDGFVIRYGEENVFMDLDTPNYTSFPDHLEEKVGVSDVLVACIGPEWIRLLEEKANSTKPDYLVREIKQALGQRHTMVATICIDGATIPPEDALPPKIQSMLKFQTPNYQFADDFLTEIGEVLDEIEQEYECRGLTKNSSMSIDSILSQSPHGLEEYLVRQIDDANFTTIRKHLRDFPAYLIDFTADLDSDQTDSIMSLGEGISVFGTTFLVHDQVDLFNLLLQSLKQVCTLAYKQFSDKHHKNSANWHEVLKILYFIGAFAVHEGKPKQLSRLLQSATVLLPLDTNERRWLFHLQRNRAKTLANSNRLIFDVTRSISAAEYLYHQFSTDLEVLTDCVCQFDLIHCLYLDLVADADSPRSWPFFGVRYFERLNPTLEKIIIDSQYRDSVFGSNVTDQALAIALGRYCMVVSSNNQIRVFGHTSLWDDGAPSNVREFLYQNLSPDEFGSLMLR